MKLRTIVIFLVAVLLLSSCSGVTLEPTIPPDKVPSNTAANQLFGFVLLLQVHNNLLRGYGQALYPDTNSIGDGIGYGRKYRPRSASVYSRMVPLVMVPSFRYHIFQVTIPLSVTIIMKQFHFLKD